MVSGNSTAWYYYNDNGSRARVVYSNGFAEEYTYHADGTIETLVNRKPDGTVMDSYSYSYDAAGNQETKTEIINKTAKGTTIYTYDALNRLLSVTEPDGRTTAYEYDLAGNRLKETVTDGGIVTETLYAYGSQNWLTGTTTKVNAVITKTTAYGYDRNGNQLTTAVTAYENGEAAATTVTVSNTYDLRNQLIRTETADGTVVVCTYNGEGYRVTKEVTKAGASKKTFFLYEGDKAVLELDGNGLQTGRNVYGTNLLFRTTDGITYSYLYNGHGDVTALVMDSGEAAASYYYDAFGNITESTGTVDNSIRYAGYQYDVETGLYYINARMYDPLTARFLQEDSYTGDAKDPLSLNLYTYCHNEPVMYTDPTGHARKNILKVISKAAKGFVKGLKKAVVDDTVKAVKSIPKGIAKAAKGIAKAVANPAKTLETIKKAASPKAIAKTGKAIGSAVAKSFKDNVINGDAESRGEFAGEVVGQIALAVIGTKGVDKAVKAVKAASAGKAAAVVESAVENIGNGAKAAEVAAESASLTGKAAGSLNAIDDAVNLSSKPWNRMKYDLQYFAEDTVKGGLDGVQAMLKTKSANAWGTLADGTNQGIKHFNNYWKVYPERIPSIANRVGIDPSDFSNTVSGFENFTQAAQNVIANPNQVRTIGEKTLYFVEGAENANKGVTVIVQGEKIQSMMPTALKDFLKLK